MVFGKFNNELPETFFLFNSFGISSLILQRKLGKKVLDNRLIAATIHDLYNNVVHYLCVDSSVYCLHIRNVFYENQCLSPALISRGVFSWTRPFQPLLAGWHVSHILKQLLELQHERWLFRKFGDDNFKCIVHFMYTF